MEYISIATFVSLFTLILIYPKYVFAAKFLTHYAKLTTKKPRRLSGQTRLLCAVPFLNNALLHRVMGQKIHASIDKTLGALFGVVFIMTTIEQFIVAINPWIIFVSWIALMTIYAATWINDAVLAFRMAVLLERGHVGLLCVFPPICFYLLVSSVALYFKKNKDELTGTFEPIFLDT